MRVAVFLLSAAILGHEICLLRILSLAYWHHAAALVVSVALLGFGVAGTVLALRPGWKRPEAIAVCACLYALLIPLSLYAARKVDFNVLEVGWDSSQWWRLLGLEAIFLVPFLVAALGISVALALHAKRPGATYAANLIGSGVGAVFTPWLLGIGPPSEVLQVVSFLAAFAAPFCLKGRTVRFAAVTLAVIAFQFGAGSDIPMSPFKALPSAPNKRILETRWGPLGRVDRAAVPALHYAPGFSYLAFETLPENQEGLYVDGHLVGAIDRGDRRYLDRTVSHLPFLLVPRGRVTQVGFGPGLSLAHRVVDPHADLIAMSGVRGAASEGRAYLGRASSSFDLIVHHLPELHAASVTPMLTVEGLALAFDRVRREGAVALSCALVTPPRAGLRLIATALRVTPHVVAVRTADRLCVVLRKRAPTSDERERVLEFCRKNSFDPVLPREWRLDEPYHAIEIPLDPPGADYPYEVAPVTDARPYFFKFFRWSRLGEVFDAEQTSFVEWPYIAMIVAFAQVTLLGLLLMAWPLRALRSARSPALLFVCLGLAFMLLEMAFLHRAMMRTGSPVLAAAAVIGGFLVGSGLGSLWGERLGRPRRRAALIVALVAPLAYLVVPPTPWAVAVLCGLVALPMGMPFPSALARLSGPSVPWALAWNGCASVAAAAGAPLLSSTFGIPVTLAVAAALYLFVAAYPDSSGASFAVR